MWRPAGLSRGRRHSSLRGNRSCHRPATANPLPQSPNVRPNTARETPQTIEGDWDRFYVEFPDIYDRLSVGSPLLVRKIDGLFGLDGKVVVDAGSGTGESTFELAKKAKLVIGIEPWPTMRDFAVAKQRELGARNVLFVDSVAQDLPLRDASVDLIVDVYGAPLMLPDSRDGHVIAERFLPQAERALQPGGCIVHLSAAPGFHHARARGLLPAQHAQERRAAALLHRYLTSEFGFDHVDVDVVDDCGSLRGAIETFGLIYGQRAINYLRARNRSRFRFRVRVHYKQVRGRG
jgi:SAM-dependent methyltransferase